MLTKIVIIFMLFAIIFALGAGLFYLMKNEADNQKMVKALTWRIIITISMLAFILIAYHFDWIHPNQMFLNQAKNQ